jgi:DNA recombination protein RmuC
MDILSVALGLSAGIFIALLFSFLWYKSRSVSKSAFDDLTGKYQELNTQFRLSEEKYLTQKAESDRLSVGILSRDSKISQMIATNASQETAIANHTAKISEQSRQFDQLSARNVDQQAIINQLNDTLANTKASYAALRESFTREKEVNEKQQNQLSELSEKVNKLTSEHSTLLANNRSLNEKLATQKEEITELQTKARIEFENIANKILEEKSGKFTETNRVNLEAILKPLGENIDSFKKKVDDAYNKEARERFTLEKSVKDLVEQTNKVSAEANNLASALKGQTKKQGDWGEMILESILEKSGLTKGREYTIQDNMKDETGKNQRPDVMVHLPENRKIIIDSKVSLVAFDKYSSAENPDLQRIALKEHINSIYSHIDLLAPKRYDLMEGSLDFVMMFIPVEPAYLTAIQADPELWSYAYNKRILLISPTNLIAALKLVTDLWKREQQNRNALEIARQGEKLYEKFVGFLDTMDDVGKNIGKAQDSYTKAMGQLKDGRGNLVGQALKLKQLGIKSDKTVSPDMLPSDESGEE